MLNFGTDDRIEKYILNSNGVRTVAYMDLDNSASTGTSQIVNGETMEGVDQIEYYTLNARNQTIQVNTDRDADGTIDLRYYRVLDENGDASKQYFDLDAQTTTGDSFTINGQNVEGIDKVETYNRDANRYNIRTEYDQNADGVIDSIYYIERDANGNSIALYRDSDNSDSTGKSFELNGQTITGIDRIDSYTLNAQGRNIQISYDYDVDGTSDRIHYFELDANGNQLTSYQNVDGSVTTGASFTVNGQTVSGIDRVDTYVPNTKGNYIQVNYDYDVDGTDDAITYYDRNANNNVVKAYYNQDNQTNTGQTITINGASVEGIDRIDTYTLNTRGEQIQVDFDFNADGTADRYAYIVRNELGYEVARYQDSDNDVTTGYTYVVNGKTVSGIDIITSNEFDNNGRSIKVSTDSDGDGNINNVHYVVRNTEGFEVARYRDTDNNEATGYSYTVNNQEVKGISNITYNKLNALGLSTTVSTDSDGDGDIDTVTYIVRNSNGYELARYEDRDNNESTGYSYEVNGETVKGITYITQNTEFNASGGIMKTWLDTAPPMSTPRCRPYWRRPAPSSIRSRSTSTTRSCPIRRAACWGRWIPMATVPLTKFVIWNVTLRVTYQYFTKIVITVRQPAIVWK